MVQYFRSLGFLMSSRLAIVSVLFHLLSALPTGARKEQLMPTRILAVLACIALAACTSSEATVDGETVTVKADGSALLYNVETLTMVAKEKATSVCLAHGGSKATLEEIEGATTQSATTGLKLAVVQVMKSSGFLDMFPAQSVTKRWKCK